jgi:hypothetical protein
VGVASEPTEPVDVCVGVASDLGTIVFASFVFASLFAELLPVAAVWQPELKAATMHSAAKMINGAIFFTNSPVSLL